MDDIIAAIATAPGEAAIAVLRLAGEGCVALADRFFRSPRTLASEPARRMALGEIVEEGFPVDQVLAVRFEKGASYTGEESVEIHCHGGGAAAQRCLELFLGAGARVALPGEFTKRAFLNGRIDLAQAEAVLGVIRARSDSALRAAGRSLQGDLSRRLRDLADGLTALRAELEVRLDYPEEVAGWEADELAAGLAGLRARIAELLDRCRAGVLLKNGVSVALLGRPNVGKSSLLNALLGEERAIVTAIPGTTRDTVDAAFVHRGLLIRAVDTAGIRETGDEAESLGVARSRKALAEADIPILVIDASAPLADADREVACAMKGKSSILVLNKCDLPVEVREQDLARIGPFVRTVALSALTNEGLDAFRDVIYDLAAGNIDLDEGYAATERIVGCLREAMACVDDAIAGLADGVDVAGSLLAEAAMALAAPLGADAGEDLLDAVFANFCVGK